MIRKLTYQDIPSALRARQALEAQRRLQGILGDPASSAGQREFAQRQQAVLRHWSQGTLPTVAAGPLDYHAEIAALESPAPAAGDAPPPSSGAQEHLVEVKETVSATEG